MRTILVAIVLVVAGLQHSLIAQAPGGLIGTWKLVSASTVDANGRTNPPPYGSDPTGFLSYSRDGRMTAPADERAQAFATFLAYAGRYTVTADKVTHHIEAASRERIK